MMTGRGLRLGNGGAYFGCNSARMTGKGLGCDVECVAAAATEGTVDPVRGCIPVPYAPPGPTL